MKVHCPFLFLLLISYSGFSQHLDNHLTEAYHYTLQLKTQNAAKLLLKKYYGDDDIAFKIYISSLNDFLQLILRYNEETYHEYLKKENDYEDALDTLNPEKPMVTFVTGEITLHSALLRIHYGDQFAGALKLIKVYNLTQKNEPLASGNFYLDKTSAIIHILLSMVPGKYHFILSFLRIHPDLELGIQKLKLISEKPSIFQFEGSMLYALLNSYYLNNQDESRKAIDRIDSLNYAGILHDYLSGLIAVKGHNNPRALTAFENCRTYPPDVMFIPLSEYYLAGAYLKKLDLNKARETYQSFLAANQDGRYVKACYYHLYQISILERKTPEIKIYFNKVLTEGSMATEDDQYAYYLIKENQSPLPELLKARLLYDGGYFRKALKILDELDELKLDSEHHLEFFYRKGRVLQALEETSTAIKAFNRVFAYPENKDNYLVANSHLQLGYIYKEQNNMAAAREEFGLAMQYKGKIYQNSIVRESKTAYMEITNEK